MAKIKGKWKWNKVVYDTDATPVESKVVFTSNGEQFDEIIVFSETVYGSFEVQYMNLGMLISAGRNYAQGEMFCEIEEKYRTMDFGETEQDIDDYLNEFILANASEVSPIAEKLVEVANNVPKVFEAGKQQGRGEGYDSGYDAGLEAGKELGGYNKGFEAGKTEGYNHGYDDGSQDGYNQGHKDGKEAEYDTFWDTFQNYGSESGISYNEVFGKGRFTDANYDPKYPIQVAVGINSGYAMFNGASNITDIKVPIYHRGTNLGYLFNSCGRLKRIPALHILAEVTSFQAAFEGCNALEDITITGTIGQNIDFKACTKLTQTSITSIVNALSDSAVGKTLTLSKAAVDKAFETSEGANDGASSQEWDSLEGLKMNWEITLV